jgi:hypothetical protein
VVDRRAGGDLLRDVRARAGRAGEADRELVRSLGARAGGVGPEVVEAGAGRIQRALGGLRADLVLQRAGLVVRERAVEGHADAPAGTDLHGRGVVHSGVFATCITWSYVSDSVPSEARMPNRPAAEARVGRVVGLEVRDEVERAVRGPGAGDLGVRQRLVLGVLVAAEEEHVGGGADARVDRAVGVCTAERG